MDYASAREADLALRWEISTALYQRGAARAVAGAAGEVDRNTGCAAMVPPALGKPLHELHARRTEYIRLMAAVAATKEEALRALRSGTESAPLMTYASTEAPVELARRYDKITAAIASQFRDLVNMTLPMAVPTELPSSVPAPAEDAAWRTACIETAGRDHSSSTSSGGQNTAKLSAWLLDHVMNPHPTKEDKEQLEAATGMTRQQINDWFVNKRQRCWKPFIESLCKELSGVSTPAASSSDMSTSALTFGSNEDRMSS